MPTATLSKARTISITVGRVLIECSNAPVVKNPNAAIPEKKRTVSVQGAMIMKVAALIT